MFQASLHNFRGLPVAGKLALTATFLAALALAGWLALAERGHLPDFQAFEAGASRKAEFFAYIAPLVEAENARVREARTRLEGIAADPDHGWFDRRTLDQMARWSEIQDRNFSKTM